MLRGVKGIDLVEMRIFFFQAEDGIRGTSVTGVQTCALPIFEEGDGAADGCGRAAELAAGAGKTPLLERGDEDLHRVDTVHHPSPAAMAGQRPTSQIGRASCRERGQSSVCARRRRAEQAGWTL